MTRLPRTLTPVQKVLKKLGITKYDFYKMPITSYFNMEHIKLSGKSSHKLIDFTKEVIGGWKMITDAEIKGRSLGSWTIANGIATLEGDLVTELTEEQKQLGYVHTGFIAVKSSEFYPPESFDWMDAVKLRVKTDKRLYLCQIKTLSPWEEDLYQGIIPIPSDEQVDQWRDVVIPYEDFYLTFRGYIEDPKIEFDGRDIKHVGLMMAERKPGPFKMDIEHISVCKRHHVSKRYTGLDTNRIDDE